MNSIPPGPSAADTPPPISATTANAARNALDTHISTHHSTPIDARNRELQDGWGKPYKLNSKENPLSISVYKRAGHDKHGAWFARRSIHQGIGFAKWKRAWQAEFGESLAVKGGPGAGAVRGITADRRIESKHIDGVGELEGKIVQNYVPMCMCCLLDPFSTVWQLSAVFPGPVTPREFVELVMSSDNALSEASACEKTSGKPPRHFMVVSRPTKHDDAPSRSDLVCGTYESVEMIRELPIEGQTDSELNPVEWTMITRSDPGGGIPRFMVERGTPGGVVADTAKFLDWACPRDDFEDEETATLAKQRTIDEHNPASWSEVEKRHRESASQQGQMAEQPASQTQHQSTDVTDEPSETHDSSENSTASNSGFLASTINYVGDTAAAFLPTFAGGQPTEASHGQDEDDSAPLSRASSTQSFMSADDGTPPTNRSPTSSLTERAAPRPNDTNAATTDTRARAATQTSLASSQSSLTTPRGLTAVLVAGDRTPMNNHEKELLKLHRKLQQHDEKTSKEAEADSSKTAELETSGADDKARDQHAKAAVKRAEKAAKEREKLEERTRHEEQKAAEKAVKEAEKGEVAKMKKERDEAREGRMRAEVEIAELKKEVDRLKKELIGYKTKEAMAKEVNGSGADVTVAEQGK